MRTVLIPIGAAGDSFCLCSRSQMATACTPHGSRGSFSWHLCVKPSVFSTGLLLMGGSCGRNFSKLAFSPLRAERRAWGQPGETLGRGERRQQANIPDGEILAPVQGWRDQVLPRGVALVPAGSSQAFWDCLGFSLGRSWDHVPFQGTSFLPAITYPHVYVSQPTVPG